MSAFRREISWNELPVGALFKVVRLCDGSFPSEDLDGMVFRKTAALSLTDEDCERIAYDSLPDGEPKISNAEYVVRVAGFVGAPNQTVVISSDGLTRFVEVVDDTPSEQTVYTTYIEGEAMLVSDPNTSEDQVSRSLMWHGYGPNWSGVDATGAKYDLRHWYLETDDPFTWLFQAGALVTPAPSVFDDGDRYTFDFTDPNIAQA